MTPALQLILREHSFLQGLSEEQIACQAEIATRVSFDENQIIVADHEQSSDFYFLISGSVAIELRATRFALCVQALGPGQVFGWSALLDHQDTLFQVRAREDTEALRVSGEDLKALCRRDAALGSEILQRPLQVV